MVYTSYITDDIIFMLIFLLIVVTLTLTLTLLSAMLGLAALFPASGILSVVVDF